MPEGWLSDVNFFINDDPSAPGSPARTAAGAVPGAGTGASNEGFSLTRDEAEELLRRARRILTDINWMLQRTEFLGKVTPPADDPASVAFNARLVGDGGQNAGAFGYGVEHLKREQGYLDELVQRLSEALGLITDSDHVAMGTVNQATDGGIL